MYRVVLRFESYPFETYSEALAFKAISGGVIYELAYHCSYERR